MKWSWTTGSTSRCPRWQRRRGAASWRRLLSPPVTPRSAIRWRHYTNLEPWLAHHVYHRQLPDAFLKWHWDYYRQLLAYRQQPSAPEAMRLSGEFDELFSTVTGYAGLDQRIAKTKANKGSC